jgi:hypothetical protein
VRGDPFFYGLGAFIIVFIVLSLNDKKNIPPSFEIPENCQRVVGKAVNEDVSIGKMKIMYKCVKYNITFEPDNL